ncbi:flavodoxin [Paenibacillus chitinolyticus]|uniref:flavodoxin n=1 Tax=Paenibacillus chitinolyticus TaxID=79263 RepID=UPI0036468FED
MSTFIVVYASLTGNTEEMADAVAEGIKQAGGAVTIKDILDARAAELEAYDGIVLGAYTWGDGELPDEFLDFYEEMDELKLSGKIGAVFGSCDSSYAQYGAAVDLLTEKLQALGCTMQEGLKIELCPSAPEREACREFGRQAVLRLQGAL